MNSNFHPESRIWLYLSSRVFTDEEVNRIDTLLQTFCKGWAAHGSKLYAQGEVLNSCFVMLMVDETAAGASGCSIDKSVHFIQHLEEQFQTRLFDRFLFAWKKGDAIKTDHLNNLQQLVDADIIAADTIVFDTLVKTKKDFDELFEIPLAKSWMRNRVKLKERV